MNANYEQFNYELSIKLWKSTGVINLIYDILKGLNHFEHFDPLNKNRIIPDELR